MTHVKQESNEILLQIRNKTTQSYDKKTYLKLVLNILRVVNNSTSINTHWTSSSKKFINKFSIYMWPMFTHVHPCVNYK